MQRKRYLAAGKVVAKAIDSAPAFVDPIPGLPLPQDRRQEPQSESHGARNLIIATIVAVLTLMPSVGRAALSVFGAAEVRSSDLTPFPKWNTMVARYAGEQQQLRQPCQQGPGNRCMLQQWTRFLDSLQGLDRRAQVEQVHLRMNTAPYIEDILNYGIPDYWATPGEFFDNSGDCEDFAISKFMSLRLLGFSNDDMRIAVVQDTNLNIAHAVLIVYLDGQSLLLDNQISQVVPVTAVTHYVPYFTINEQHWWQHTP